MLFSFFIGLQFCITGEFTIYGAFHLCYKLILYSFSYFFFLLRWVLFSSQVCTSLADHWCMGYSPAALSIIPRSVSRHPVPVLLYHHLLQAHLRGLLSHTRPALPHSAKVINISCYTEQLRVTTTCIKAMVLLHEEKQSKLGVTAWSLEKWLLQQQIKLNKRRALGRSRQIQAKLT